MLAPGGTCPSSVRDYWVPALEEEPQAHEQDNGRVAAAESGLPPPRGRRSDVGSGDAGQGQEGVGGCGGDGGRDERGPVGPRDLTVRIRDTFRYATATVWLGFLAARDDPQAVLRTIPELVAHAQATGQHILLTNVCRDLLMPLAAVRRYQAPAILKGAATWVSLRSARAAEAVSTASMAPSDQRKDTTPDLPSGGSTSIPMRRLRIQNRRSIIRAPRKPQ